MLVALVARLPLLAEKPFWRDEAWVAQFVVAPFSTFSAQPHSLPVGFLLATKAEARLPLAPEVGYRILPLLTGIALVPLLGRLAVVLGAAPPVPLLVVWLAAGMPALVYYSRELKPYGLDALIAALAPLLALRLFGRGFDEGLSPRTAGAALVALTVAAPWMTYGSAFTVAALFAWGWLCWWRAASPVARRWWLAANICYAASFALVFLLFLDSQSTSARLHAHYQAYDLHVAAGSLLARAAIGAHRYVRLTVGYPFLGLWPAALFPVLLGAWRWPRPGRGLLCWLYLGAGVCAVAAALGGRFLLAKERLLLFALPQVLLAAAAGLETICRLFGRKRGAAIALACAAVFSIVWTSRAIAYRVAPRGERYFVFDVLHDVDAMIATAATIVPAAGPIYIGQHASHAFAYYSHGRLAGATVCVEPCDQREVTGTWLQQNGGRGWMIVTTDEAKWYAEFLAAQGIAYAERAHARGIRLWAVHPSRSSSP
jgi:hypothetical protein